MKGQQISPWTFLKEANEQRSPRNQHSPLNKVKFRLPKLAKNHRIEASSRAHSRIKNNSNHIKTMVLVQMHRLDTEEVYPQKKKTEPLLREAYEAEDEPSINAELINSLLQTKLITKLIRASLEQEINPAENRPNHPWLDQIRKKMISIPQPEIIHKSTTVRIHDKNIEANIAAMRSILKKQYQNLNVLKNRGRKFQGSHISVLKLKLTEDASRAH